MARNCPPSNGSPMYHSVKALQDPCFPSSNFWHQNVQLDGCCYWIMNYVVIELWIMTLWQFNSYAVIELWMARNCPPSNGSPRMARNCPPSNGSPMYHSVKALQDPCFPSSNFWHQNVQLDGCCYWIMNYVVIELWIMTLWQFNS